GVALRFNAAVGWFAGGPTTLKAAARQRTKVRGSLIIDTLTIDTNRREGSAGSGRTTRHKRAIVSAPS
ncbi:MAG: hypothetical protein ACTHKR_07270, partial [Sphingomonas sp.]